MTSASVRVSGAWWVPFDVFSFSLRLLRHGRVVFSLAVDVVTALRWVRASFLSLRRAFVWSSPLRQTLRRSGLTLVPCDIVSPLLEPPRASAQVRERSARRPCDAETTFGNAFVRLGFTSVFCYHIHGHNCDAGV